MKLIVGLGNIGKEYEATRHNVGFMVADYLAAQASLTFSRQAGIFKEMELAKGDGYILLKPHTMMNLSGRAIQTVAHYYKIEPADVWVIHDDFDLDFGKLRLRQGGSSGGHNGLKSTIESLGKSFGRVRVGIRNQQFSNPIPAIDFVLQKFASDEQKQLSQVIEKTASIIMTNLNNGSLSDTSYSLIESVVKVAKSTSAGGVVVNKDGDILVVSQGGRSWSLPKGHLEKGELPRHTAEREIQEESGITDLTYMQELGKYNRFKIAMKRGDDPTQFKTIIMFLFTTNQTELNPVDPHNPEARWVAPDQVEALLTHPKDREFFASVIPKIKILI